MNTFFQGIFETTTTSVNTGGFFLCIVVALVLGMVLAFSYEYKNRTSKSFLMTMALLPSIVAVVIMMVNGNVGAGVAVAGAFSLVRFRSVAGSAKDISAIFLAMASGLMVGMGYLGYAICFTVILCIAFVVLNVSGFGEEKSAPLEKSLRITVPEDLNYTDSFGDILEEYTTKSELMTVKTTNMGSLFKLAYHITLKENADEKAMIDALRTRNGNLEISISAQEEKLFEL